MRIKRKKNSIAILLFVILLLLGIGYAALSTSLRINGTSDIIAATWNIKFQNVRVMPGSVTPTSAASINAQGNTVTYAVTLTKPGDFYEFTVDVKNNGTIDGMISQITATLDGIPIDSLPDYLEYYAIYSDGSEIEENHLLAAGSTDTYRVHIGYYDDISANQLPTTNQSLSLSFGVTYTQANAKAEERLKPDPTYIYQGSTHRDYHIGYQLTDEYPEDNYETYQELRQVYGHDMFIRHRIEFNIIIESYVGFIIDGHDYYLRGGGATPIEGGYNDDSIYYDSNKALLQSVFGADHCEETWNSMYSVTDYHCSDTTRYMYGTARGDGYVSFDVDNTYCDIEAEYSNCQRY